MASAHVTRRGRKLATRAVARADAGVLGGHEAHVALGSRVAQLRAGGVLAEGGVPRRVQRRLGTAERGGAEGRRAGRRHGRGRESG